MDSTYLLRELPLELSELTELALDLRWTWSHAGDALWRRLGPRTWERTENPWMILQDVSHERLEQLAEDPDFKDELQRLAKTRKGYLNDPGWYGKTYQDAGLKQIAYFSMEFGLGEALPLYAGGLGILAGDYLKAASDLGIPLVGIGLLYQEGYFRQIMDAQGRQQEAYPYNDPTSLPISPVRSASGGWLHIPLELPGRTLLLRVWCASVGRVCLYLLDSNDPLNSPTDRCITSKLYGGGQEMRLLQEISLGIGGWRALEALGLQVEVCHINEGHGAMAVLERTRSLMEQSGLSFWEALWATRAGNVFTTHTPVTTGFDTYSPLLIEKYFPYFRDYLAKLGISSSELLALGRKDPHNSSEPFNMAYLAMRGCFTVNAVSRLHGTVSRRIFRDLYPGWPEREVPIGHVTNGVHVPSWDSPWSDDLWTRACGKRRWLDNVEALADSIRRIPDEQLWGFCAEERRDLVNYARERLARQLGQRGAESGVIAQAYTILDPNVLTLGFARRFAEYKRPNLLLEDPERLALILTNPERPVQLIVAGKAHPEDELGKRLVQAWVEFEQQPKVRNHVVFLEDYDIALAQELVQGVDVWINTPRRPWEACGTSGMKVLVNGGLNLSELDGWWAEAYSPEIGWALGDGKEHSEPGWDSAEAEQLYYLLENEIVPEFYARDSEGIPRSWVARMRASMAQLAPEFSSNRMVREYVEKIYLPAAYTFQHRSAQNGKLAKELYSWATQLKKYWHDVHFANIEVLQKEDNWSFSVQVYLGELEPDMVKIELYADPQDGEEPVCEPMKRGGAIPGAVNGYFYHAQIAATRPAEDFTPRITPYHQEVRVPIEMQLILWQR